MPTPNDLHKWRAFPFRKPCLRRGPRSVEIIISRLFLTSSTFWFLPFISGGSSNPHRRRSADVWTTDGRTSAGGIQDTFHRVTDTRILRYGLLPRVLVAKTRMSRRNLGSRIAFQMTAFESAVCGSSFPQCNWRREQYSFILIYCAPRC